MTYGHTRMYTAPGQGQMNPWGQFYFAIKQVKVITGS